MLGSHQIKKIFAQANVDNIDLWPLPWKVMYERCAMSKWYSERCLKDLYDSNDYKTDEEDSFDILPDLFSCPRTPLNKSCVSIDSWLEAMQISELTWEQDIERVEAQIKNDSSTALKGIPGSLGEPTKRHCSTPSVGRELPNPKIMEQFSEQGGDESNVFSTLAPEPEGVAEEPEQSTCNSQVSAKTVSYAVRLPPYLSVSCRITPTGETILNFQWGNK